VQEWLKERGKSFDEAMEAATAELSIRAQEAEPQQLLYDLLFNACAEGRFVLEGIEQQPNPRRFRIPYNQVPTDYFFLPTRHFMGLGYYGNGQLGPDLSVKETFDALLSYKVDADRRPFYVRTRIRRIDALALKEEFEATRHASSIESGVGKVETPSYNAQVSSDRRRGRKPKKIEGVMQEMRKIDPKELDEMLEKELVHKFGGIAQRTTLRDARKLVLAEQK